MSKKITDPEREAKIKAAFKHINDLYKQPNKDEEEIGTEVLIYIQRLYSRDTDEIK